MSELTPEKIKESISKIVDPTFGKTLEELNHIQSIKKENGSFLITITLNTIDSFKNDIKQAIEEKIGNSAKIKVNFISDITRPIPPSDFGPPGMKAMDNLPSVKNVIAIASNKGGVGKSTVSANIACSLKSIGAKVGILDLDLYGPNIPTMFGLESQRAYYEQQTDGPIKLLTKYDIPMMSVGFILPEDDTAVVLRAPLVNKLIMEFLTVVEWPELDYLIVDLPPGTGDIQLTMAQQLPTARVVFVTTPQKVALADVYKGIRMFQDEAIKIPVLGIIENMSYFVGDDGKKYEIFGKGGADKVATDFEIENFGQIPIVPKIREQGDEGKPIVLSNPENDVSKVYVNLTRKIINSVAQNNEEINATRKDKIFMELDLI